MSFDLAKDPGLDGGVKIMGNLFHKKTRGADTGLDPHQCVKAAIDVGGLKLLTAAVFSWNYCF